MMLFLEKWKGIEEISNEELCRAILACQNDYHEGHLSLKILEFF